MDTSAPVYFGGDASDLGRTHRLAVNSFRDFVDQVLNLAVPLNVTRAEFAALSKADRHRVKRVPYVVPATFATSPSQRLLELAQTITLLCLDIDDPGAAAPYSSSPETLAEQLAPFNFALHTTASHTPSAPRLRLLIEANHLPVSSYTDALLTIAARIGLLAVNKESRVAVQPMYLPTLFKGDTRHPLIWSETGGRAFSVTDLAPPDSSPGPGQIRDAKGTETASGDDLDYLRAVVDGVDLPEVAQALTHLDPDCSYGEWLEVAAALRHQFPFEPKATAAYELFDTWSAKGTKYVSPADTMAKWSSLRPSPRGRAPVTIRSILARASKAGWDASPLVKKCFRSTLQFLGELSSGPDGGELASTGLARIAATPLLSRSEEEMLINVLIARLRKEGLKVSAAFLRKDLTRIKAEKAPAKPTKARLPDWGKGLCYVSHINQFLRPATSEYFSPEALDRTYGSKLLPSEDQIKESGDSSMRQTGTPVIRPQDFLLNLVEVPVAYDTLYDPQQLNDTFIHREGKTYVNTYIRNHPEPDPLRAAEAAAIFVEHLERLIAEPEYRTTLLDFMAYIVQHPGYKIRWAVLLQGVPGCGKTVLAEAMKAVLGRGHVTPVDNEAMRSSWNDWAYGNQLVVLEEIRVAGQNRHDIMNRLKPLITNDTICINQRFRDSRTLENRANYMLFTNHHDALAVSADDRRYFVIQSAMQTKAQVEALPPGYFARLHGMFRDNASGLRAFLEAHAISPGFNPDGHAPVTSYFEMLLRDVASDVQAGISEFVGDRTNPLVQPDLLSSTTLMAMLEGAGLQVTPQHLASVLRESGWMRAGRFELADGLRHPIWCRSDAPLLPLQAATLARLRAGETVEGSELL